MSTPDLTHARLKLDRARYHIADLEAKIAAHLASDFYRFTVEEDQASNEFRYSVEALVQPDVSIATVIGDAIGNLRSALDYFAVALISPIVGYTENIGFPFADNKSGFQGTVEKGWFSNSTQEVRDLLIKKVQAYQGGNGETLWAVNKLRNIDKHRVLVTTAEFVGMTASLKIGSVTMDNCTFFVSPGEKQCALAIPRGAQFTNGPTPAFQIHIKENCVSPHTNASGFLHEAANNIQTILDQF